MKKNKNNDLIKVLAITYSVLLSIYTCLRHEAFMTRAYDLGIFMQALWTTAYANKFFFETPDLGISEGGSFFGVHFSPIMLFLLLLYCLFPHAYTLLIFQTFLLGFAAIPLYKLAREITKNQEIALAFSIIYLIYPPIIAANLFDFHLESFFPIIFFTAFYYLEKKEFNKFYLTLIIGLTILDFASAVLVLSTLFYATFIKYRKYLIKIKEIDPNIKKHIIKSIILIMITIIYFKATIKIIAIFGTTPFSKTENWPDLGSNINEILLGLLNPYKVAKALSYDILAKISWIIAITLPLLFLPFFAPLELIPALPWIAVALLSRYPPYYQLGWQYGALYAPFIFYAAINGYKNITQTESIKILKKKLELSLKISTLYRKLNKKKILSLAALLSILSIIIGLTAKPTLLLFEGTAYVDGPPIPNQHTKYLREILSYIPDNASVLAQNNIFPHVAHRVHAYTWIPPNLTYLVDYAIGDVDHPEFYMLIPNENFRYSDIFQALINSGKYKVYASADGIILLKKNHVGPPVFYIPIEKTYNYKNIKYYGGYRSKIENSTNKYTLIFKNPRNESILWYGPYIGLPPGKYTLTFRIKIVGGNNISESDLVLKLNIHAYVEDVTILNKTLKFSEAKNGEW
ncbi:MAG: hypothetical protein DRP27_07880, partial [Thermotogae bacterium]